MLFSFQYWCLFCLGNRAFSGSSFWFNCKTMLWFND